MRRRYNKLVVGVDDLFRSKPTHLFSINEVSKEMEITWRTAKNILNLLWRLGQVRRPVYKKRAVWQCSSSSRTDKDEL